MLESTDFSPNNLVLGHSHGPLAMLQADWKKPPPPADLVKYVNCIQNAVA